MALIQGLEDNQLGVRSSLIRTSNFCVSARSWMFLEFSRIQTDKIFPLLVHLPSFNEATLSILSCK